MLIKFKQDKVVSDVIDALSSIPTKYVLKHNKSHSKKQKRVIRKAFNEVKDKIEFEVRMRILGVE